MNLRKWLGLAPALLLGAAVLARPAAAAEGFSNGVALCLTSLLPALFPFFVICTLVTAQAGKARFPVLVGLSWLGGYAVCAQLAREAAPEQRRLLLLLGCCSGPGFVIGCLGGQLLGSVRLGILLYGLQLACNLLAAAILLPFARLPAAPSAAPPPAHNDLPGLAVAIGRAVDSALAVCGCVLFFRVIAAVLEDLVLLSPPSRALLRGGLEITAGCGAFAALGGRYALQGVCLCLSLLGASVFSQLRALAGSRLPLGRFALSRLIHAAVLQLLTALCSRALPGQAAVFRSLQDPVILTSRLAPDCAFLLLCFLGAVLYKLGRKFYNTIQ